MFVTSIFCLTAQTTFAQKCLKILKTTLIETFYSQGSILLMGDFNSRTEKSWDCVSQEGNTTITNDQSQFSSGSTPTNSFDKQH